MNELAHPKCSEGTSGFINNSTLIAVASTFKNSYPILDDMMTQEGGANDWATLHHIKFKLIKSAIIEYSH